MELAHGAPRAPSCPGGDDEPVEVRPAPPSGEHHVRRPVRAWKLPPVTQGLVSCRCTRAGSGRWLEPRRLEPHPRPGVHRLNVDAGLRPRNALQARGRVGLVAAPGRVDTSTRPTAAAALPAASPPNQRRRARARCFGARGLARNAVSSASRAQRAGPEGGCPPGRWWRAAGDVAEPGDLGEHTGHPARWRRMSSISSGSRAPSRIAPEQLVVVGQSVIAPPPSRRGSVAGSSSSA